MSTNKNNPRKQLRELYCSETDLVHSDDISAYAEWLETQLSVLRQSLAVQENPEPLYLKPEIENLKVWMSGRSTTGYQRSLAMREFEQLLSYVAELEQLRQPPVIGSFTMQDLMLYYQDKEGLDFTSKVVDVLNCMVNNVP